MEVQVSKLNDCRVLALDLGVDNLAAGVTNEGRTFLIDGRRLKSINQQFVILENSQMEQLKEYVRFGFWEKYDDSHTVVRFASSWATTEEGIQELRSAVPKVFV